MQVSLAVLDTVCVVEAVVAGSDQCTSLLASVLRVILHALNTTQSCQTLHHLFAIQRSLVSKYPNLLFDEATEHCAALCKVRNVETIGFQSIILKKLEGRWTCC